MIPTVRAAWAIGAVALLALVIPVPLAGILLIGVVGATLADAVIVRGAPGTERTSARILARGVPSPFAVSTTNNGARGTIKIRQPLPPDIVVTPNVGVDDLRGTVVARRRGRHMMPSPALRTIGPLGLGAWQHRAGPASEVLVYPDIPMAHRIARAVQQGRFRDAGRLSRGPLGLGTEFEAVREYSPDDDIRQVNWRATARVGRPMSNQYRVEQDREVVCLIDSGRLMGAPLDERTRLDAAVDAAVSVAVVADDLGDHCGTVAFDTAIRRVITPRRRGSHHVIRALFDLEPTAGDADYALAFRQVGTAKRSFVLIFTDLLDEAAAQPLVEALPVLVRRHAVTILSATDTDLLSIVRRSPIDPREAFEAVVAQDILGSRTAVARRLRSAGADVIEAPPAALAEAAVGAYLRAKARAQL